MRSKKAISHPELQAASAFASKAARVASTADQHKTAGPIVEHLEQSNWKIEPRGQPRGARPAPHVQIIAPFCGNLAIPGARSSRYFTVMAIARSDGFVDPCIPTLAAKAPAGADWVHAIKHEGYRLIVR